jgi:polyferredoxin/Pyruvate/2-oxoacid:ferredoxin oxidoreductase delta subunit
LSWKIARYASQTFFLLAFLVLLLTTSFPLSELVPVEVFLLLDPLLAAAAMLSARAWIGALSISLIVVALTLVFGRFFCGWVCPLGTTIDVFDRIAIRRERRPDVQPSMVKGKYVTMTTGLVLAAFGVGIVGWIDPLCLATRSWGGVVIPAVTAVGAALLGVLDSLGAPSAADALAGGMDALGLPVAQSPTFDLQILFAAILATILALSMIRKRFWCRSLCPLGGGLALLSRWRLFGPVPAEGCSACTRCENACTTGALAPVAAETAAFTGELGCDAAECTQCMSCIAECGEGVLGFGRIQRRTDRAELKPGRRAFLGAGVAGAVAAPLILLDAERAPSTDRYAIRPPGAQDEKRFLDLCVRCGQCARGCPTGGLQPSGLEGGLIGLFSPRLVPRHVRDAGYCAYECNLCGRICPTGAIPDLPLATKQETKIGIARFDVNRCIPFEREIDCVVCEEHCPTSEKAIKTERVCVVGGPHEDEWIHMPRVDEDLCIGCGICEAVCPLPGPAAIRIERLE